MTKASIVHRRALNQVLLYAGRAPAQASLHPAVFVRALRSVLRMSQSHLARRCGIPQAHIARVESGTVDIQLATLRRVFDAMFCDLLIFPRARQRPTDVVAERYLNKPSSHKIWDD